MKTNWIIIFGLVLSLVVLHTAGQIEYWNYHAGNVLPMDEPGKLRGSVMNAKLWREEQARRTGDESLLAGRPLAPAEQESLDLRLRQARALNQLVDWTRGMGLLQYPLAPFAFGLSLVLALTCVEKRARRVCVLFAITNAIAIVLMLFRGYYND